MSVAVSLAQQGPGTREVGNKSIKGRSTEEPKLAVRRSPCQERVGLPVRQKTAFGKGIIRLETFRYLETWSAVRCRRHRCRRSAQDLNDPLLDKVHPIGGGGFGHYHVLLAKEALLQGQHEASDESRFAIGKEITPKDHGLSNVNQHVRSEIIRNALVEKNVLVEALLLSLDVLEVIIHPLDMLVLTMVAFHEGLDDVQFVLGTVLGDFRIMKEARDVGNDGSTEGGTGSADEECVASLPEVDRRLVSVPSGGERREGPVNRMIPALSVSKSIPSGTAPNNDEETVQEHDET